MNAPGEEKVMGEKPADTALKTRREQREGHPSLQSLHLHLSRATAEKVSETIGTRNREGVARPRHWGGSGGHYTTAPARWVSRPTVGGSDQSRASHPAPALTLGAHALR